MRVNGKSMQTIWFDNELNAVQILDQTMLPFKIQLKQLNTLEDSIYTIKNMSNLVKSRNLFRLW